MSGSCGRRQDHLDPALPRPSPAPAAALNDRSLKHLRPKLRHLEADLAGLGLRPALIVPGGGVPSRLATLVEIGLAQPIRLGLRQRVQRFLHASSHDPVEVVLDPLVVNRECSADSMQSPSWRLRLLLAWLRLATSKSARFGAASPT